MPRTDRQVHLALAWKTLATARQWRREHPEDRGTAAANLAYAGSYRRLASKE